MRPHLWILKANLPLSNVESFRRSWSSHLTANLPAERQAGVSLETRLPDAVPASKKREHESENMQIKEGMRHSVPYTVKCKSKKNFFAMSNDKFINWENHKVNFNFVRKILWGKKQFFLLLSLDLFTSKNPIEVVCEIEYVRNKKE